MKKNIGSKLALYPTPAVVVGAKVNGKTNWLLVAHLGIIGHDRVMVSLHKAHYTNQGYRPPVCQHHRRDTAGTRGLCGQHQWCKDG